ncbi:MAG: hypothetical protein Tsb002_18940 [Wenzhouxiangellaceae bacterium]
MKQTVSDEVLILLYYGEHEDPDLPARVAREPELQRRFDQISATLACLDEVQIPATSNDAEAVWARLAPALPPQPPSTRQPWLNWLLQPRLSLAGGAALAAVFVFAFWLGGRFGPNQPAVPEPDMAWQGADLNRFLARHLDDAERWLSHYSNQSAATGALDPQWTRRLLNDNRFFRLSVASTEQPRLSRTLDQLEFILLHTANASPRQALQPQSQRVLFQLRLLRQQYNPAPRAGEQNHVSPPII